MPSIPEEPVRLSASFTVGNEEMSKEESQTPDVMYGWRVEALYKWIESKKTKGETVNMELLSSAGHLDQYHYLGLDSNEDIISLLQADSSKTLLDVGCGIGGPARHISWKSGAKIHGVDIQDGLVKAATRVAAEVGLQNLCTFETGDCTAQNYELPAGKFDSFYSSLVFLHIPLVPRLRGFKKIYDSLKGDASFVIEDYVTLKDTMTQEEIYELEEIIGVAHCPSVDDYRKHLESVGFTDIHFEDLTSVWTKWTSIRRDRFLANRDAQVALQGEESVANMERFYRAPPMLFETGKLGGVRITGKKGHCPSLDTGRVIIAAKKTNEMTLEQVEDILNKQKTVDA